MVNVETVRVSHFLIVSMGQKAHHLSDLTHFLHRRTLLTMRVLHRHEDKHERVVGLLDDLIQKVTGLAYV